MHNLTELLVRTLVLYSLREVQLGYAKTIRVEATRGSFSVADDGRGHAFARVIDGSPYLQFIYEHLDYPFGSAEGSSIQLQGLGMSLLNSLCTELAVVVCKADSTLHLHYEEGRLVRHELTERGSGDRGNRVIGRVSDLIATSEFKGEGARAWLKSIAAVTPGLALYFNGDLVNTDDAGAPE